ncbi:cytochrome c-type biogenesis protein CcmH [Gammaproteobacteria bacterium]
MISSLKGFFLVYSLLANVAVAFTESEIEFQDRMRRLEEELRCLVCQNQSLADSHAELANDLRRTVENLAKQGKSDEEILLFLKERYGDFVSYRPPFNFLTAFLWISPFLGLGVGGAILYFRRKKSVTVALSAEEESRIQELMKSMNHVES